MIEKLEKAFALSEKGAKDIVRGFIACAVHNLTLFIPVSILYFLVSDLFGNTLTGHGMLYMAACLVSIALIMLSYRWVYKATYFSTYVESGVRRVSLAERLRKIPLSYFGKKDLADMLFPQQLQLFQFSSLTGEWDLQLFGHFLWQSLLL